MAYHTTIKQPEAKARGTVLSHQGESINFGSIALVAGDFIYMELDGVVYPQLYLLAYESLTDHVFGSQGQMRYFLIDVTSGRRVPHAKGREFILHPVVVNVTVEGPAHA
jgi:hypothetical protein